MRPKPQAPSPKPRTVLAYSGGLDSSCLWWIMGKPPALYVGGSKGSARDAAVGEMLAIAAQCAGVPEFRRSITIADVDLSPFMRPGTQQMPREQLIASVAWARGYDGVAFGYCAEDGADRQWCARVGMAAALAAGPVMLTPSRFDVDFPASGMTKRELVTEALAAGAPRKFILASHSCLAQAIGHCGQCRNCVERKAALG